MTKRFYLTSIYLVLIITLISACSGLAGDVEIVETLPAATPANPEDALTTPADKPDVVNGQRIFLENCTRCHGENAAGDGELVASGEVPRMPSFLESSYVQQQSLADLYTMITNGNIINLMPPWADSLSVQERWDVASYLYTLNYDPAQVIHGSTLYPMADETFITDSDEQLLAQIIEETGLSAEEARAAVTYRRVRSLRNYGLLTETMIDGTENDAPPPESIILTGAVQQGTEGFSVPAGLPVILRYGNLQEGLEAVQAELDENNRYHFANIPYEAHYIYSVVVGYQDHGFLSEIILGTDATELNDLPITIYETSDDPTIVILQDVSITIDATVVDGLGSGLVIWQKNIYRNDSDKMVYITPPNQDVSVSVLVQLPPGSIILSDDQDPRYIPIRQDTPIIIDTQPVYPGEHIVDIAYFLPYERDAVIDLPLNNRFDGTLDITLMVPQLEISGEQIEQVTPEASTVDSAIKQYRGEFQLDVSQSILFDILGALFGSGNTSEDASVVTRDSLLPLLAIIFVVFLGAIGGVLFLQQRANRGIQGEINRLVAQITELEALHERGQINHDVFQQQRQELKAKLAAIMTQHTQSSDK